MESGQLLLQLIQPLMKSLVIRGGQGLGIVQSRLCFTISPLSNIDVRHRIQYIRPQLTSLR